MESPLHLLRPDSTHTSLVCIPDAIAKLRSMEGPCVVCSLVGTQRQGKSSLLNLLHKRSCVPPGFGIGHYMDPKTHGLHFWSKPHPRSENVTVIYLDTEGLDAPHVDQFYNWTLSAVSLLISDVYMYQSKGSIDTNSIDRLAMILRVAEQLRGDASQGIRGRSNRVEDLESRSTSEWQKQQQSSQSSSSGSSFLWLLRDHQLNMKSSPRDEMIEKLDSAALRTVRRCFDDYDCVPLPVPVDGGAKELQNMEKMSLQDLSQDFREEFLVLERRILERLRHPRTLAGSTMTGPMLADMLESFTAAVQRQDGAMADIAQLPTQREMIVTLAGDRAVKAGVSHYKQSMDELFRCAVRDVADANDGKSDEDAMDMSQDDKGFGGVVIGHRKLLNHHNACLRASKEIFDRIATDVLDGDEGARFKHIMVEKIVGWKSTFSAEEDNGYHPEESQDTSNISIGSRSSIGTRPDCLYRRERLENECIFAPIWRSNQQRLRARCEQVLRKLYSPLKQSLDKRIDASLKALADAKDTKSSDHILDSNDRVGDDEANSDPGHNDTIGNGQKAASLLPTSEKFSKALESIRVKFLRDKGVQETGSALSSRVFSKFQRDVMVPDSMRLVEAIAKAESSAEIISLEQRMRREMGKAIASVRKAAADEINSLKDSMAKIEADREAEKAEAKIKEEQRATAIEAIRVAAEEGRVSLQRGIEEERGSRERLGSELRDSISGISKKTERSEVKLVQMQEQMLEKFSQNSESFRKMIEQARQEIRTWQENSISDVKRAIVARLDETTQKLSTSIESKTKALAADANHKQETIQKNIELSTESSMSAIENVKKAQQKALLALESKLSQGVESSRLREVDEREERITSVETKVAKLLKSVAGQASSGVKDAKDQLSKLKEFVTKQLTDVGEGIAMTHTRVESLESALGIDDGEEGIKGDDSFSSKLQVLSTQFESFGTEQKRLKQADADLKSLLEDSLEALKSTELPEVVSSACSALRSNMEPALRQAWLDDMATTVAQMIAEEAPAKKDDLNQVLDSINALETKTDQKAVEMDNHLISFRKSLTDEIARELSECKLRIEQTEDKLQSTAQQVLADAATKDNLARVEAALEERIADIDGMLSDVNDSDNSSRASMEQEFAKVREEMIRRDQLLESQIVEAHTQLQKEAQAIVAPAKTHIASLRNQITSLNERLAIASESQGKQQSALIEELRADHSTRIESLASTVGVLEEQKGSGVKATKQLELKLNKVYKALSREATRGREDREGLWGSLSELSCRISEIRAIVE